MKLDLTGVKGALASVLIVLSLIIGVLNAVQGALPPSVETLGVTNLDDITLSGDLTATNINASAITATTAISAAALKIASNTLSGFAIISAAVTNGALVSHNLGAIPKVICQPIAGGTNTSITDTIWISASNTTSFTVGVIEALNNRVSADTVNINCLAFR